jgi:hypothetical protein
MPRKRQQKRRTDRKNIAPLPQASLTTTSQAQQGQGGQAVDTSASLPTSAAEGQSQKGIRPRTGGGGIAAHEYVMPELRRIAAMMAITAILLVVLTIVLR